MFIFRCFSRQPKEARRGKSISWFSTNQAWPTGRRTRLILLKQIHVVSKLIFKSIQQEFYSLLFISTIIMFIFNLRSKRSKKKRRRGKCRLLGLKLTHRRFLYDAVHKNHRGLLLSSFSVESISSSFSFLVSATHPLHCFPASFQVSSIVKSRIEVHFILFLSSSPSCRY